MNAASLRPRNTAGKLGGGKVVKKFKGGLGCKTTIYNLKVECGTTWLRSLALASWVRRTKKNWELDHLGDKICQQENSEFCTSKNVLLGTVVRRKPFLRESHEDNIQLLTYMQKTVLRKIEGKSLQKGFNVVQQTSADCYLQMPIKCLTLCPLWREMV